MIYDVDFIGKNIRRLRKAAGLRQADLAKLCGIGKTCPISMYERGWRIPNTPTLIKLAKALDCRIEELFDDPFA